MKIVPPNFGYVEEGIYRSGEPAEINFPFLEGLGIRTCIILGPESPRPSWLAWLESHGVYIIQKPPGSSSVTLTEELCIELLQVLLNRERYPILVTDGSGKHRTGALIGCLRKLQRWSLSTILTEYRRFAGKGRLDNEQFIELFDVDLIDVRPKSNPQLLYCYDDDDDQAP
eukprot:Hpha_TRINITY_DN16610_c2_g4::TRINITY_DN16610_c2_g4_i2::g.179913::m.179913/K18043/OCA1; tyrosine-protein phosphatase OCA1